MTQSRDIDRRPLPLAGHGARVFQLTYNERNRLGGGSAAVEDTSLTAFGREVIDHANDRRDASPGETPTGFTFATDMHGRDQFRILAQMLSQRQIPQRRIEKIMGGNFLRYAQAIWGD